MTFKYNYLRFNGLTHIVKEDKYVHIPTECRDLAFIGQAVSEEMFGDYGDIHVYCLGMVQFFFQNH